MKPLSRLRAACAVGAILVLVAGCTSTAADGPTTDSLATPTASASVVDPSSASPTSSAPSSPSPSVVEPTSSVSIVLDITQEEAADRADVEATWARFWSVTDNLWRLPEAERFGAASEVSVEPTLSQVIQQAEDFIEEGVEAYGSPTIHPYWQQPISGGDLAVMGDCTDTSKTGSLYRSTGEKKTEGVPDNNTRVTLLRGADGQWRVEKIFYLMDVPCP